jgi:hypothetical protein
VHDVFRLADKNVFIIRKIGPIYTQEFTSLIDPAHGAKRWVCGGLLAGLACLAGARARHAGDGVLDGKKGSGQISMGMGAMMGNSMMSPAAGTTSLAAAVASFMGSAANLSGLTIADMSA